MMTLGPFGFLDPWLLTALLALPAIWWLLRFTPPRPKLVVFPPTRLLRDLEDSAHTAEHSPWWLTLLRMLLAALVILALARPLIHPDGKTLAGTGPVVLVVDNGWASATHWPARQELLGALIARAERESRPVMILPTAAERDETLAPLGPDQARERVATLSPRPYDPDRAAAGARLAGDLDGRADLAVIWLSDGLDYGHGPAFAETLGRIAGSDERVTLVSIDEAMQPLALRADIGEGGALTAHLLRSGGAPRSGRVFAYSSRGERLGAAAFTMAPGSLEARTVFELPLEIRNQVARLDVSEEQSAGAVHLLDRRSQWRRVGIISGETRELAQPLLSPLYYVERALSPFAELATTRDSNISSAVDELLERNLSTLVLADIGKLLPGTLEALKDWIGRGGTLVRFAGPRLEKSADALLPVPLRRGGRALGGSLSWTEAQPLLPFDDDSPFAGLTPPGDVKVHRQVLADPAAPARAETWARLQDGTPLVSADRRGNGQIVLFHVTANSDWSNLPMSGLFVHMLRRIVERSVLTPGKAGADGATAPDASGNEEAADVLAPSKVLDGFGRLTEPAATARPIAGSALDKARPGPATPPGYYGPAGAARALNVIGPDSVLRSLDVGSATAAAIGYQVERATELRPWLLGAAVAVFLIDMIAVLLLGSGAGLGMLMRRGTAALICAAVLVPNHAGTARAQSSADAAADARALEASLQTRLAFVITGDPALDRTSLAGLSGLAKVLRARTAIEPGEPVGVNVDSDELAFYPLLYWPVRDDAETLSDATLAKIDAYMKQGGMILFDTRDYQRALPSGGGGTLGPGAVALQRLLGSLDVPPLEPVPDKHVLTKSFYLLGHFPGRWDGGTLWVEARSGGDGSGRGEARHADGVSSLLITSNDFAAAWALDETNRPLFPVVPGGDVQREMAFRVGVNVVMYALTGNYKADQVHVPALLERLGQ